MPIITVIKQGKFSSDLSLVGISKIFCYTGINNLSPLHTTKGIRHSLSQSSKSVLYLFLQRQTTDYDIQKKRSMKYTVTRIY